MINNAQFRAARALLGLSQKEVAEQSGISSVTLSRIETGEHTPEGKTVKGLQSFYEDRDIEFKDGGAIPRRTGIVIYEGQEGFRDFMDDVYRTALTEVKQNICIFNGMPKEFIKWLGADWYKEHSIRMQKIKVRYTFRVIVQDEENALIGSDFAEYRHIDTNLFGHSSIYVYSNRVAIITFSDTVRIIRIDREEFADSQRILFELVWGATYE